ncbi:DNA-processing protein DprA [Agromyces seonyuensis]|uniref:DNA-processing protein DprA n=1 Tax=Agromyces seonyuensis TaxID=2662446 RepID=A0A6I4NXH1_9MICO|nr:DNA-processing protein DprA [Agromyces seonyuensis]MWB99030.1 DNA-processing protein DprA [Agromyces seonyuensis]
MGDEREARMLLATVSEPADIITGVLVDHVGVDETARLITSDGALPDEIDAAEGALWRRRLASRLIPGELDRLHSEMDRHGIGMLVPGETEWPVELRRLGVSAPLALWFRGDPTRLRSPLPSRVSVVGSRAATTYGTLIAGELASDLVGDGRLIISGGAYGIDEAAHRAANATKPGHTIPVLAGGLDRPHPPALQETFERIVDHGGLLVSELPPGSAPSRWRLLQRGRLIAALSAATVVVEAGARSGALNIAGQAHALGRPVGVVPGPLTSPASAGNHSLIREGIGTLVTNAKDVAALIDPPDPFAVAPAFAYDPLRQRPATAPGRTR